MNYRLKRIIKQIFLVLLVVGSFVIGMYTANEIILGRDIKVTENKKRNGYDVNLKNENYNVVLSNDDKEIKFLYEPKNKKLNAHQIKIPLGKKEVK